MILAFYDAFVEGAICVSRDFGRILQFETARIKFQIKMVLVQ